MGWAATIGLCLAGILLLATIQPGVAQRGNPRVEFEGESIDGMIADFMEEHRIPGMTLAIVQAPYISRVTGYGKADVTKGLLASPKTLWNIGQMTQAYTAVAVMQLVEAGKLTLDDPVGKHVPDLPAAWKALTVRHLLGHTSGLPDYTRLASFRADREYRPEEILALVREAPLAFTPGSQVAQSATNYLLLGQAVSRASGMSFEAYVTENQIRRLGLKNTLFPSMLGEVKQEAVESNDVRHREFLRERAYVDPTELATGYAEKDGRLVPAARNAPGAWNAYGSVLASAEDISLWDIGLAGELLVKKPENRQVLYSAIELSDGTPVPAHCGWRFPKHRGLMDIRGNVPGFSTYLSRFTDKSELVCVTLCANREGVDLTELARRIAGAFDRKLGPPVGPKVMRCLESCYSVRTTMDRLEGFLKSKGVTISAKIDHAAAAKKEGLELRPSEVLVFGNPAVGTRLMQSRQHAAIDLPLRVLVWEQPDGTVWTGYQDIAGVARKHGIKDQDPAVEAIGAALEAAIRHAVAPY